MAPVGYGIEGGQMPHDTVQIGLRLGESDARLDSAYAINAQTCRTTPQWGTVPLADQRKNIASTKQREVRRQHADDRVALVVQPQDFSHRVRRLREFALPQGGADDSYGAGAGLIFLRPKVPPQGGINSEHREELPRDEPRTDALRFASACQAKAESAHNGHRGKRLVIFLPVTKI